MDNIVFIEEKLQLESKQAYTGTIYQNFSRQQPLDFMDKSDKSQAKSCHNRRLPEEEVKSPRLETGNNFVLVDNSSSISGSITN